MMRKFILPLLLVGVLLLTGCQQTDSAVSDDATASDFSSNVAEVTTLKSIRGAEVSGNYLNLLEQNRSQNDANFAEVDGWYYGQNWKKDGTSIFVKVRTDGSDYTVLDTGFATHIYVKDGYIYYMLINDSEHGIYKMRASGEGKQKVSDAYGQMQIVGQTIYYADYTGQGSVTEPTPEQNCHLYSCDLDGNNVTEIIKKPTFFFYVFEDGIIYQDDNDKCSIHICDLDGSNDFKVNDERSFSPIYDGEYIFYVRTDEPGTDKEKTTVWKVKPDGTEHQQVSECEVAGTALVSMEHIYFINPTDSFRLYSMKKDGSELTLITQDKNIAYPQFFEDCIKYTKYTDDQKYMDGNYFCHFDGSGRRNFRDLID